MAITREISGGVYSGELPFPVREERGNGGDDGADMRVPPVSEGREREGVPVRDRARWAAGCFWSWARSFPWGPILFLFSFASFLFLFSLFLSNTFQI
jgi:hypothetical protein